MQTANGTVILSPENQQFKYGITPGEALILYKLHKVYANGTPLGDFFVQPGEAQTIEKEGKPAEEEYYNPATGKAIPAKAAVEPVTHKRTQTEEIARLKRKYTGNITENGVSLTAFIATFGSGAGVRLPETFAEIEEFIGGTPDHPIFRAEEGQAKVLSQRARANELAPKLRADLCDLAIKLKLRVHAQDSKESIIQAIIAAESDAALEAEKPVAG
jgi:hypothetical protein